MYLTIFIILHPTCLAAYTVFDVLFKGNC